MWPQDLKMLLARGVETYSLRLNRSDFVGESQPRKRILAATMVLSKRSVGGWPARYATVLSDDPGSSVLTLTSVGMVDLSPT